MTTPFVIVIIGAGFALLGAISAFLISYTEYSRHFMARRKAVIISLETAFVIFIVFIAITVITVFIMFRQ